MGRFSIFTVLFLLFCFMVCPVQSSVKASPRCFTFQLDHRSASEGDLIRLKIRAKKSAAAAGFRTEVWYDDTALRFVGTERSYRVKSGTVRTNGSSNPVYSVYVCDGGGKSAPKLNGTVLTYVFQVKTNVLPGKAEFSAKVDQICDYSGKRLSEDCIGRLEASVGSVKSGEAYLTDLEPSVGKLSPAFDPDKYRYTLAVGSNVRSVSFQTETVSGASVSVSRKRLGESGTKTSVIIKVTSGDKKTSRLYEVDVSRAADRKKLKVSLPYNSGERSPKASFSAESAGAGVLPGNAAGTLKSNVSMGAVEPQYSSGISGLVQSESAEEKNSTEQMMPKIHADHTAAASKSTAAIYLVGNRMPAYLVGMLVCGFCIVTGIALELWLSGRKK